MASRDSSMAPSSDSSACRLCGDTRPVAGGAAGLGRRRGASVGVAMRVTTFVAPACASLGEQHGDSAVDTGGAYPQYRHARTQVRVCPGGETGIPPPPRDRTY